jgi:hypothetical protein
MDEMEWSGWTWSPFFVNLYQSLFPILFPRLKKQNKEKKQTKKKKMMKMMKVDNP